jgi:hypothetical protein
MMESSRRAFLRSAAAAPLLFGPLAGCASVVGDQEIDAYFVLKPNSGGAFAGWTEITLEEAPGPNDSAVLKRVTLTAPTGMKDLTFLTSIVGSALDPMTGAGVPLVRGDSFPKNDTIGVFKILYADNLRRFFKDGTTLRVDWSGSVSSTTGLPPEGGRLDMTVLVGLDAG